MDVTFVLYYAGQGHLPCSQGVDTGASRLGRTMDLPQIRPLQSLMAPAEDLDILWHSKQPLLSGWVK
jgi:hypothetical protein